MSSIASWAVTGAAGYLGSHVVDVLLARGTPVLAIDNFSVGRRENLDRHRNNRQFSQAEMDIRSSAELAALFLEHRPAAVIHLAAVHFIPTCNANPPEAVSLNVHGTQSVLTAARAADVGRFWYASTGDVYPPSDAPHREDDAPAPFSIYGLTKWVGEQLVGLEARQRPEARFLIGRLFNLYGPRETNPHFLPEVLGQLRADPAATLRLGSLWPRRDLVPVTEAARALIAMIDAARPGLGTVNLATGVDVSMQEVLDVIGSLRGRPLAIETDPAKVRPVERAHLQADVSRLRELIGWAPHGDLRRGLAELLAAEPIR
jgi:UDP-glucose 4-epimerase